MRHLLDDLPPDLRRLALTHPAFASTRANSFERLEFLGDSVLDLVVSDAIYRRHPELAEGELSKIRASAVSRDSCAEVAVELGLGAAMIEQARDLGPAHAATATRLGEQRNALAALVESAIGAGFLAFGWEAVAPVVLAAFEDRIEHAMTNRVDAKSRLQELTTRDGATVEYEELGEDGPPHDRRFTMAVQVRKMRAEGVGRSKQEAQQRAAAALLALMDGE